MNGLLKVLGSVNFLLLIVYGFVNWVCLELMLMLDVKVSFSFFKNVFFMVNRIGVVGVIVFYFSLVIVLEMIVGSVVVLVVSGEVVICVRVVLVVGEVVGMEIVMVYFGE